MKRHALIFALASIAWLLGCDAGPSGDPDPADAVSAEGEAPVGDGGTRKVSGIPDALVDKHLQRKKPVTMPGARRAFDEVVAIIGKHYVDGPLPEDVLWTGAIEGVMGRLLQLEGHPINVLMSPAEFEELKVGTKGQIVGVGVAIERVADVIVIRDVIPDSPAASADLRPGDRILGVDGERVRDLDLSEVVERVRGEEGSKVELFVQRDTEEWTIEITRNRITYSSVEGRMLGQDIGYLRINAFSQATVEDVEAELQSLAAQGVAALALDLRDCPGGLIETSIGVAERFLPPGRRIVTVKHGDGTEMHFDASQDDRWDGLPLVVLIGPHTASGGEILALALSEHDRAPLVGMPTTGKGTVEAIYELDNGWALKLTTSLWLSPSGEPRHGVPIEPDVSIPSTDGPRPRLEDVQPSADPQLAGALQFLTRR